LNQSTSYSTHQPLKAPDGTIPLTKRNQSNDQKTSSSLVVKESAPRIGETLSPNLLLSYSEKSEKSKGAQPVKRNVIQFNADLKFSFQQSRNPLKYVEELKLLIEQVQQEKTDKEIATK